MDQILSTVAQAATDWRDYFPMSAMLIIYLGDKIEMWATWRIVRDALQRSQNLNAGALALPTPPQPAPVILQPPPPAPPAPTPVVQTAPSPAPVPAPIAPTKPAIEAPWLPVALAEIGFHETGNNQGISRYIAMAHCGAEGEPWCAIFANAMLEQAGIHGTRSPSSQSFRNDPNFVPLSQPSRGCIVVYWRISRSSGQGHVGFYWGENDSLVWTLGGNENDMVQIEALPKDSASFGLIGYWWPKAVPLPASGPVIMPPGSPLHVQPVEDNVPTPAASPASGIQSRITATVFGGAKSAYGPPINDHVPGVALPFRFADPRPRVRVTSVSTGKAVDCEIVDIGPWNINDPYWQTGARPEAESGTDLGQTGRVRKTNKAGIDLTVAAANAIGIDGKGLVSWQFVDPQSVTVV